MSSRTASLDDDNENLFSKVLSGMKSVFNSASKNKKKSTGEDDRKRPANSVDTAPIDPDVRNDAEDSVVEEFEASTGDAAPGTVIDIGEVFPGYPNLSAVNENTIPEYEICVLDLPGQQTSQNNSDFLIADAESVQRCGSRIFIVTNEEQQNFSLIESNIVPIDEGEKAPEDESAEPVAPRKKKQVQKKKSKSKSKTKTEHDSSLKCDIDRVETKDETDKPRIVLKFRSDKTSPRSTNMKIVSNNEKTDEVAPSNGRRSLRGKSSNGGENSSSEDSKILNNSENGDPNNEPDESNKISPSTRRNKRGSGVTPNESISEDSANKAKNTIKRSARRRSKEFCENVLANAIARKEKIYSETSGHTRLSRRIKPTAKVLANRELRLGLETQNNARLALISEKKNQMDDVKSTRSSNKKMAEKSKTDPSPSKNQNEKPKSKKQARAILSADKKMKSEERNDQKKGEADSDLAVAILPSVESTPKSGAKNEVKKRLKINSEEESEHERLNKLKKKHLKKLGLKAVSGKSIEDVDLTDESTMDSINTEAIIEHFNTRDQSSSQMKSESAMEGSDFVFSNPPNRSSLKKSEKNAKRKHAKVDAEDNLTVNESSRRFDKSRDDEEISVRVTRKRSRMSNSCEREFSKESKTEKFPSNRNASNIMSCFCEEESKFFADPNSLSEVEFCRALENIGGRSVGCGRVISSNQFLRAGSRATFFLACDLHRRRLSLHHCCAGCGVFCTQGIYYQCSKGHLFHWECSLPFVPLLIPPSHMNDRESVSSGEHPAAPKGTITDLYNAEPGCPHCGLDPTTLEPINTQCYKVNLKMNCTAPMIFLPSPRVQWVPACMSFPSTLKSIQNDTSEDDSAPILPPELLESLKDFFFDDQKENSTIDYLDMIGRERDLDVDLINAVYDSENTVEKILLALQSGADPRKRISLINDGSLVHLSALEFNLNALFIFKTIGLDINAYDNEHRTPLMLAILNYDNEIDPKDVPENADDPPEKKNIVGNTALYRRVINYIMSSGCDQTLKGPNGATVLHFAAKQGDTVTCLSILNNRSFKTRYLINQQDDNGLTPLVWAIENKQNHIARILLEHGANSMCRDLESNTPLHWAALTGCKSVVEDLLNFGSDINAVNANDDTPLHLCARQNHYNCLIVLLARGASITFKNLDGETPIDCVTDEGNECYLSLAINEQLQNIVVCHNTEEKIISNDISNGKERNPIKCINSVDDENLTDTFVYITQNCFTVDIDVDRKISSMQVCACKDGCSQIDTSCACANVSVQSWYDSNGRLVSYFDYRDPPMIFECNDVCSCNKLQCINRCIDKGSAVSLRVFKQRVNSARGGGWGVCTTQWISKGTFVVEYIGEILPGSLAYHRDDDSYLFELENKGDALRENATEPYYIDAKKYGNVSRFINHKCEPNLIPVRVFVEYRDLRFPRIAFFACKDINAGEELGFDYGEKFWNVKSKSFSCNCGSSNCRYGQCEDSKVDRTNGYEPSDEDNNEFDELDTSAYN